MGRKTASGGEFIGYARVSTEDQNPDMQIRALKDFGVPEDHILVEKMSGATMSRPRLNAAMKICRRGDVLVVWKLDRLGRSLLGVLEVVERLEKQGIELKSLSEEIDTRNPMGKAMFRMMLILAELERDMIAERTREGIKAYKARGGKMGRPHSIRDFPKRLDALRKLRDSGALARLTGREIIAVLNDADPAAPTIGVPQVWFNYKRAGFPGMDDDKES